MAKSTFIPGFPGSSWNLESVQKQLKTIRDLPSSGGTAFLPSCQLRRWGLCSSSDENKNLSSSEIFEVLHAGHFVRIGGTMTSTREGKKAKSLPRFVYISLLLLSHNVNEFQNCLCLVSY